MTQEQQIKCIEENCGVQKRWCSPKGRRFPRNGEDAEIRQWVMDCAKDAWVSKVDKTRMRRYQIAKQIYGL